MYTNVFSSPIVLPSEKISAGMYRSNGDRRGEYSIHYITLDPMCVHQCVQPSYPMRYVQTRGRGGGVTPYITLGPMCVHQCV